MRPELQTLKILTNILFASSLTLFVTACGPSDTEAQKLGFSSALEMKDIQAKGFKTKEDYAKSQGFDSVPEMEEINKKGFKTAQEYANSLGFESSAEMKSLQAKGFATKASFDALVSSEAKDPLKTCSRKLDSNYNYPISDKWTLVRCDDDGRLFVTDVTGKSSNGITLKTLFDVKNPLKYFDASGSQHTADSMSDSIELNCAEKKLRYVGEVTYYSGRMGTGQSESNPQPDARWISFNHPLAIPGLIKFGCNKD